jgi:glycosyltransferase involved in cell wall biosynthesis
MKVALVVPGGVDRSGEVRVIPALLALIARLAASHEVHVFALAQEPRPGTWDVAGARIHNIGGSRPLRAIPAILREHRAAPFALVHAIWSGYSSVVAVATARWLGIPSLVHVAGGEVAAVPEIGYGGSLRWRGRMRERVVLRTATFVSAPSARIVGSIEALGVRARRIPLGVDLQAWPSRPPAPRMPREAARLIHVGSLNRVKDQATLLHALAALDAAGVPFHMDIVGEDTLGGEIHALAGTLGLAARVRFHGFLTQRNLRPLMEAAHVNVISSRHEAGPMVLLEAAVAGVPTAGSAVGHIAEWAPTAALAVPPGRPAELAAAIRRLLDDEDLRLAIAGEAAQRATAQDADYTAARFLQLYREVAVGPARP